MLKDKSYDLDYQLPRMNGLAGRCDAENDGDAAVRGGVEAAAGRRYKIGDVIRGGEDAGIDLLKTVHCSTIELLVGINCPCG